jgi:hypothetical protein
MSINGLTEQYIPLSINGLSNINTNSIIINGVPFDPTLLVPYTGATTDLNLNSKNLTNVNNLSSTTATINTITSANSITATNPNVYNVAVINWVSSTQLVVDLTPTTDPFQVGDVLNITDNYYASQCVYQSTASSTSFYVSNSMGFINAGQKFLGLISKNTGIINSNITRNKQMTIDSLYSFRKNNTNNNLQLLYVNDPSYFYWTPVGRCYNYETESARLFSNVSTTTPLLRLSEGGSNIWSIYLSSGIMYWDYLGNNKMIIDTNGIIANVAYKSVNNTFSGTQSFSTVALIQGANNWSLNSVTPGYLDFNYNGTTKFFIDQASGGRIVIAKVQFSNSLITNTVTLTSDEVSTLSGINTGTTIQAQLNALTGSFLTKTGTNTGVNCRFTLSSGGIFDIYSGSGILFSIGQTLGKTFIFDLSSTSQINSISASYFDPTSSIQNQLDSKIAKNGVTNIAIPVLRFTSAGNYFQVQDDSSNELVSFAKLYNTFTKECFFTSDLTSGYGQIKIAKGTGKTAVLHNNGTDFYILVSDTLYSIYNGLRPFFISLSSGLLSSLNSQNFQGISNVQNIQFSDITTVPNGLTTEVGQLINWQINFRNTADRAVVTSTQGIFFRLDNRVGVIPFQWYYRAGGTTVETQIMSLSSEGSLVIGKRLTCQTPSAGVHPLVTKTASEVGRNLGCSIGPEVANYDCGMLSFNYTSSGSSNNFLGIGLFGFYERFKIYSNKAVFEDEVTVPSIKVGSGTISTQINPYILSRTDAYNAMQYGETMSCVIYDQVAWTTGSTYISWFRKFCDNSTLSFWGNVTAYSTSANQNIYWRITFDNLTDGSSYVHEYNFYFNQGFVHTTLPCVGVVSSSGNSGFGVNCTAGIYTVTFVRLNAYMASDAGDSINIHFLITPNFRGK